MKMGRTLLAYLPVNLANVLVSFGTIVVLTRLLEPAEWGRYGIAIVTMQFVHMGLFTWMEAAMARYQARAEHDADVNDHLRTLYGLALGVGAVSFAVIMPLLWLLPIAGPMKTVLAFALGSTCLQVMLNLGMEAHKAAHRIMRYSLTYSGQTVFSFSLGLLLVVLTPLREAGPFIGIIIGLAVALCWDGPFMLKRLRGGRFEPARAKRYAVYGLPICISLLLSYALNSADMYIILAVMGEGAAGEYNAGYNLANRSLEIIFIWLSMAVLPSAITALEKQGVEESRPIMRDYGATLLWIVMPAAVGIALVAKDAGFIVGEDIRDNAVMVMPWIAFAGLINGLITYYVQRAFMFSGQTHEFIWVMVPPVILNLALNFMLVPEYGLLGAVWATIAGYTVAFGLAVWTARRHYPLPWPLRASAEIALSCGVMAVAVMALPLGGMEPGIVTLLIKAAVGGAVYLLSCWAVNAADCRSFIRNTLARFRSRGAALEAAE